MLVLVLVYVYAFAPTLVGACLPDVHERHSHCYPRLALGSIPYKLGPEASRREHHAASCRML